MICTKSNHLCKKSERTRWFVTNPRISDSPRRANSPLCGERNCRTPRPHRGVRPPFLNWKFQSAEAVRFELTIPFGMPPFQGGGINHYPTPPNVSNVHESRDMRKVLLEGRRERPVLCTGLNRRRMRAPGGGHISSKKAVGPPPH